MTARRAADAGWSPWTGLLFFVPLVNYAVMLALCFAPSSANSTWDEWSTKRDGRDQFQSAALGVAACIGIGLLGLAVNVWGGDSYGASLFLATPFVLGAVSGFVYNRGGVRQHLHDA